MPQGVIYDPKNQVAKIQPVNSVEKKNIVNGF